MANYIPLSPTRHQGQGWAPRDGYAHAAATPLVPIVAEELGVALASLPTGFVRDGESFQLVALMSLDRQRNLLVHPDGRWMGGYVPASLRAHPFRLARDPQERLVLCFDDESGLRRETPSDDDRTFFDGEGEPTETLAKTLEFLQRLETQRRATQRAVDALSSADLIQPWPIQVQGQGGEQQPFTGLFRVAEKSLQQASGEVLAELQASGGLAVAYAQLYSQHRLGSLSKLSHVQARLQAEATARRQVQEPNLDELFGDGEEDFVFNFDD